MRKILSIIKDWSAVILLAMFIAALVCASVCCIFSDGKVYPLIGGLAVMLTICGAVYQLIVECQKKKGGL